MTVREERSWPACARLATPGSVLLRMLPAALLLAGCFGLWRGDYYGGRSTGGLDSCVPFDFDVSIEEGGRITGAATTTYPWGTALWTVAGTVKSGEILLETRTDDPRTPEHLLRWRGSRGPVALRVTEEVAGKCSEPRSATLHRK